MRMQNIQRGWTAGRAVAVAAVAATAMWLAPVQAQTEQPWAKFDYPEINNFNMPELEIFELDNGIRFYLVEDSELPLIDLTVLIRSGGINVPDDQVGMNNLVGSVMRSGGTETHPGDALNELLEDRAAVMEVDFGFTSGTARMNVLGEDFTELLPVFIDLLTNPAFP